MLDVINIVLGIGLNQGGQRFQATHGNLDVTAPVSQLRGLTSLYNNELNKENRTERNSRYMLRTTLISLKNCKSASMNYPVPVEVKLSFQPVMLVRHQVKSNICLHLQAGAKIIASPRKEDYFRGYDHNGAGVFGFGPALNQGHITLKGEGEICLNGHRFISHGPSRRGRARSAQNYSGAYRASSENL